MLRRDAITKMGETRMYLLPLMTPEHYMGRIRRRRNQRIDVEEETFPTSRFTWAIVVSGANEPHVRRNMKTFKHKRMWMKMMWGGC